MKDLVKHWMEITFVLILVSLVLRYRQGFASGVGAISRGYVDAVRVLKA